MATVEALADELVGAPWPVALFGHSLGASVAFEVARRLARRGPAPVHLFVSARAAPQRLRPGPVEDHSDAALLERVAQLGGTAPEVLESAVLRRLVLPALRQDYGLAQRYGPGSTDRLPVPVTAFAAADDPVVPVPTSPPGRR